MSSPSEAGYEQISLNERFEELCRPSPDLRSRIGLQTGTDRKTGAIQKQNVIMSLEPEWGRMVEDISDVD